MQRLLTASSAPFRRILNLCQVFSQYKERSNVILSHILFNFFILLRMPTVSCYSTPVSEDFLHNFTDFMLNTFY